MKRSALVIRVVRLLPQHVYQQMRVVVDSGLLELELESKQWRQARWPLWRATVTLLLLLPLLLSQLLLALPSLQLMMQPRVAQQSQLRVPLAALCQRMIVVAVPQLCPP